MLKSRISARLRQGKPTVLLVALATVLSLSLLTELIQGEVDWTSLGAWLQLCLAVARDLAPSAMAFLAVCFLATYFVQRLYKIDRIGEALDLVNRLVLRFWASSPQLQVTGGAIGGSEPQTETSVGGPAFLAVPDETVVLLERGGRFTRIQGRGSTQLEPFERIYEVIDLHPQRCALTVRAMSQEGIPVSFNVRISYETDGEGRASKDAQSPVSDQRALEIAVNACIQDDHESGEPPVMDSKERVLVAEAGTALQGIVAQLPLAWLLGLTCPNDQSPRQSLQLELERLLNATMPQRGVRVLSVELVGIKAPDEITQLWNEARQQRMVDGASDEHAQGLPVKDVRTTKSLAQAMLVTDIVEAFRPIAARDRAIVPRDALIRLLTAVSRASSSKWTYAANEEEVLDVLRTIRDLIS